MSELSRRALLGWLAAGTACTWLGPAAARTRRGWVDVHHHFIPPGYAESFAQMRAADGSTVPVPPTNWDLQRDLEDMDRGGVSTAILSMFVPPTLGTVAQRAQLARLINEAAAQLAANHRGRFGTFAALPLPDLETSLTELAYAADRLHADGFTVYTNVGDRWLGDASFEPLYAELDRRRAVLFVHPTTAACCANLLRAVPDNVIEYAVDTTRAIANVIFSGVTVRYPNIRFIFSHGGGTVPFLIERFLGGTSAEIVPGVRTTGQAGRFVPQQPPRGALAELRSLHYDTAQCSNPLAMRALRTLVPVSQILYGSDYFYRTNVETADALRHCGAYDARELEAVGGGNARRLLAHL